MTATAEIIYREFYDLPRMFVVSYSGKQYLYDGTFDGAFDDYPDTYQVYLLPNFSRHLSGSWVGLSEEAEEYLGEVLVSSVVFDESRRRAIDPKIIEEIRSAGS